MARLRVASPVLGGATIQEFRTALRGTLLCPGDAGYDAARTVWNGEIDVYPALIARCGGVADVITAVQFARSQHLRVAVRCGGHNVAGHAVCDDGLVIDLSAMKGARVDLTRRMVRAEAGLTWGELDRETQVFGLATTGGRVTTTGIAGLTLGGGIGWLARMHGLTCDNLLSADLVTADGRYVTASAAENADLFWGLRGGGGNFGIVTSFEYQLHAVSQIYGGMVLYPAERTREVLQWYREYAAAAPDALSTLVAWQTASSTLPLPEHLYGMPVLAIYACYAGSLEEGARALEPLRAFGPPMVDLTGPMSYAALQTTFDAGNPPGRHNYWTSHYLSELDDRAIDAIAAAAAARTSLLSQIHLHQLGGAVCRVGPGETAYHHRDAAYALNILAMWTNAPGAHEHIRWARDCWRATRPFATGGVYVNFTGNEGQDRVRDAYGANYERLVSLKMAYDPTNFFHLNQNIRPAAMEARQSPARGPGTPDGRAAHHA